jgi:hypothetical protein
MMRARQVLYNTDCISDQAIIYWHAKGSKPQGRQHFLKGTEALVKVRSAVLVLCANVDMYPPVLEGERQR